MSGAHPKLTYVVPTRNRASLAVKAVDSLIGEGGYDLAVIVSDNSTDPSEASRLAHALRNRRVTYVRPPESLSMPAHWSWALETALARAPHTTHVGFLSDRWIMRPKAAGEIVDVVTRFPGSVVSYGWDTVYDFARPVRLRLRESSGTVVRIPARRFLELAAKADVWHIPLPRMLNSVAPVDILDQLRSRFGAVFGSVAPDYCFAYRCLAIVDEVNFYDRSCMIDYALDRSTGTNLQRSGGSEDLADFLGLIGPRGVSSAAPIPEVHAVGNVMMHEYCVVRAEANSGKLPAVDGEAYMRQLAVWVSRIPDQQIRIRSREVMRRHGWDGVTPRLRPTASARLRAAMQVLRRPSNVPAALSRTVIGGVYRLAGTAAAKPFWLLIARAGINPPGAQRFRFRSSEDALAWALRFPRRTRPSLSHLGPLVDQ